jgi:histidyl-tRNA synthetase
VAIHQQVFARLGLVGVITKVNHRGVLAALMESAKVPTERRVAALTILDKLDKVGPDGVRVELVGIGLSDATVERLMEAIGVSGASDTVVERLRALVGEHGEGVAALRELEAVFSYLAAVGVPQDRYTFDVALVRGLGYYTGPIFESVLTGSTLGSLGGGGRYDRLIGQFIGRDLPCTGVSFGVERIFDALEEQHLLTDEIATTTQALVTLFSAEMVPEALALATALRQAGIRTEVYPEPRELRTQLAFANKKGIPLAVLLGPDELAAGAVVLRDLGSSTQRAVPRGEVVAQLQAMCAGGHGES